MVDIPAASLPLLLFVAGILVTAAEAVIPGAHFVVLGVALTIAGLLGMVVTPLASPIALAGTTLLVGAVTFWLYRNLDLYGGTARGKPMDSDALKGKEGTVTERVTPRGGQVKLEGGGFNPFYRARSVDEEIPEGESVVVLDPGGGNVVTVAPVTGAADPIDRELAAERERSERAGERERSERAGERERSERAGERERSEREDEREEAAERERTETEPVEREGARATDEPDEAD